MTMTIAQGPTMNSVQKVDRISNVHQNATVPTSYAAIVNEHGEEVEITDAQISSALEALEAEQLFPFGSQQTETGLLVAREAPARVLHS